MYVTHIYIYIYIYIYTLALPGGGGSAADRALPHYRRAGNSTLVSNIYSTLLVGHFEISEISEIL